MRGPEPGGPTPTEGHSCCHFSKLFEAVKSRNDVDDAIAAPLAALIEPFQIHFAFMESRTPANIYLCCYWLKKTKLGVQGGWRFLTLQQHCRCGRSLSTGLNIKMGVDTMERNQLKVERDWIVIQSVPGRGRLNAFSFEGEKHRVMEKVPCACWKLGRFFFFSFLLREEEFSFWLGRWKGKLCNSSSSSKKKTPNWRDWSLISRGACVYLPVKGNLRGWNMF